jgi:hypothetical protein
MGRVGLEKVSAYGALPGDHSFAIAHTLKHAKVRQARTIQQIADALATSGVVTISQQARTLGLCRSTVWTIRRSSHKASGLSPKTLNRILSATQLPPLVRMAVLHYVETECGRSRRSLRRINISS